MKGLPEDLVQALRYENGYFNKDTFLLMIRKPLHLADSLKLPLYCGEFGCLPSAPRAMRLQWYKDMVSLLEKNNIAGNWDIREASVSFSKGTG
jgi:endoglucanase